MQISVCLRALAMMSVRLLVSRCLSPLCRRCSSTSSTTRVLTGLSRIESTEDASRVLGSLEPYERIYMSLAVKQMHVDDSHPPPSISGSQLRSLALHSSLPFVGFGLLDNGIMILAGEYIDTTFGVWFGISTMAAAALGNIISDICGMGCSHYIEAVTLKLKEPRLSPDQLRSTRARRAVNVGRTLGIVAGCLIGMLPLLGFDEKTKISKKHGDEFRRQEEEKLLSLYTLVPLHFA